jgi:hypothetical protein
MLLIQGLWERLLDIRIRIQKPVTIANMMPQSDFENYTNHDTVKEKLVECNSKLSGIMKKLVSIQMVFPVHIGCLPKSAGIYNTKNT